MDFETDLIHNVLHFHFSGMTVTFKIKLRILLNFQEQLIAGSIPLAVSIITNMSQVVQEWTE